MGHYVGIKENAKPLIFESEKEPNKETHAQYDIVYGPFKNKEYAEKYVNTMEHGVCCHLG